MTFSPQKIPWVLSLVCRRNWGRGLSNLPRMTLQIPNRAWISDSGSLALKWPHTAVLYCVSVLAFSVERAIWFLHMCMMFQYINSMIYSEFDYSITANSKTFSILFLPNCWYFTNFWKLYVFGFLFVFFSPSPCSTFK